MQHPSLAGLLNWSPNQQMRNENLNEAFLPRWKAPTGAPEVAVPQGNTNFDPLLGTGWDKWYDQAGASNPGGMNMNVRGFGNPSTRHEIYSQNEPNGQGTAYDTFFQTSSPLSALTKGYR